jgi:hypothetical protein
MSLPALRSDSPFSLEAMHVFTSCALAVADSSMTHAKIDVLETDIRFPFMGTV